MKKLIAIAVAVVLLLAMAVPVIAPQSVSAQENWGGKNAITVNISWSEGYTMYLPDGTKVGGPWVYPVGPVEFKKNPTSETYRTTDMEAFMGGGTAPEDILGGFLMVNRKGKLHGEITYISGGGSGATIYQEFWGQVTVSMIDDDTATMEGEYHDRVYVKQPDGTLVLAVYGDYQVTPLP